MRPIPIRVALPFLAVLTLAVGLAVSGVDAEATGPASADSLTRGAVAPRSISVLAFAPDGTLYLGDGKGAAVYAIETREEPAEVTPIQLHDLEGKIAARLGTRAADVLVHDLAVHPISHRVFLAVSHGRAAWTQEWTLPNHVASADLLLVLDAEGRLEEFALDDVRYARAELPNPVAEDAPHPWIEGVSLRTDTITDLAVTADTLFVAGLSNEEFASTLWRLPLPFADGVSATTLEIFHGAHGAYETQAPIRTFVPFTYHGEPHVLAAYLCTPLTLFRVEDLKNGTHLKGRTIAELGAGSYPLDMVTVKGEKGDRVIMAHSNLPLMIIEGADIESFEGSIIEKPPTYTAGVEHVARSPTALQQLDLLGDAYLLVLQRAPSGSLDLSSMPLRRG